MALDGEPSDSMLHMITLFKDVAQFAHKRLTTTVEEDKSVQEHFEDVNIREEKAVSEKLQLQQKLKLERLQRQRQLSRMQKHQESASSQLTAMTAEHASEMKSMRSAAAEAEVQATEEFSGSASSLEIVNGNCPCSNALARGCRGEWQVQYFAFVLFVFLM
jgi:hypothetical protein